MQSAGEGEAVETLAFILHNLPAIGERTLEHLSIVSVAVGVAIVTGVPLGIAITQSQRAADTVLYLGSIVMPIPCPILDRIGISTPNSAIDGIVITIEPR